MAASLVFGAALFICAANAHAAGGIDTPSGVHDLPFLVEGAQFMNLNSTGGLTINTNTTITTGNLNLTSGDVVLTSGALTLSNGTETIASGGLILNNGSVMLNNGGVQLQNGTIKLDAGNVTDMNGSVISSNTSWWGGCFGSDCTGGAASTFGVYGNGVQYGVMGVSAGGLGVVGSSTTNWSGWFSGANGVYGAATSGAGVEGLSNANWGGYFSGNNGVYGTTNAGNWGGYFQGGSGGVYGSGAYGVMGSGTLWGGVFQGSGSGGGIYAQGPVAGDFQGDVDITGTLAVYGGGYAWSGCYGYTSGGGAGGPICSSGVYNIMASQRMLAQEFNAWSDKRKKKDIEPITIKQGQDFVAHVKPVQFHWRTDKDGVAKSSGYIAQQLAASGYNGLVAFAPDKNLKAQTDTFDGVEVKSPDGMGMTADYQGAIPYLHAALRGQSDEIAQMKTENDKLAAKIEALAQEFESYKTAHP